MRRRPTTGRRQAFMGFTPIPPQASFTPTFDVTEGSGGKVNTQFWGVQAFNGVSYGALLFLVGSGLSLIFGVMRIVNLSHGSYFLLGGYVALSVINATGSWALSLPAAALAIAALGIAMERLFLRPLGSEPLRNATIALGL